MADAAHSHREQTRVAVVGCGYVGYPLALLAASAGYEVTAVDIDPDVVERVNSGRLLIDEPGFETLSNTVAARRTLTASTVVTPADIYVIAVPTPVQDDGTTPDTSSIAMAAASIAAVIEPGATVIVQSTVPPGTCHNVVLPQLEHSGLRLGEEILLAHCPERVLPGCILYELVNSDRTIGGLNAASTSAAAAFYRSFVNGAIVETDLATAEFSKLLENTFRDVNIALANQVAEFATAHGVDVHDAIRIANHHPRVEYLTPGIGVGGHCIPVDPWFLLSGEGTGDLIRAARAVNDRQPRRVADQIRVAVGDIDAPKVVLIGAAYKPDVDDSRNSPALMISRELADQGVLVEVYDPLVEGFSDDLIELAVGADAVVILVPHRRAIEEISARHTELARVMRRPILLDASSGSVQKAMIEQATPWVWPPSGGSTLLRSSL